MPGDALTMTSTIQCPHGGVAILITSNTRTFAGGAPVLLESDIHPILGCPFTVGLKYSPCIRIEWSAGASKATIRGKKVLVESSIGKCINPEGASQGVAVIVNTQIKAFAQ
ncbi:MAG TPA: hypothetical protein VGC81_04735 [Candidatus Methylomirabilis sp.]|jgi:hypothetical protein